MMNDPSYFEYVGVLGILLRLIQVGVGGFGRSWTDIVDSSKFWDAVAYVDINEEALDEAAAMHKMPKDRCFKDLESALTSVEADAVLIVVPPKVHMKIALQSLKAGLHVLIEKPLADTMENAKRIVSEADKRSLKLMVSQNYRFRRGARTIRRLIKTEKVGKPRFAIVNFHKSLRIKGFRIEMKHPLLIDMAIHHFDMMRYMFNSEPLSIYCETWRPEWSWFKGDPCATVLIRMENGICLTYTGSWVSLGWETTWDGDWRIECSRGGIHWNGKIKLKLKDSVNELTERFVSMPLEDRAYSLYEFAEAIINDREPETSGKDNLKSLAMVFASLDSARSGKPVLIDEYL